MSEKFVVNGGLSIPSGNNLEIGTKTLSSINDGDTLSAGEAKKNVIPSEHSVATYVASQLSSADLDITVGSTNYDIDLDTESLVFAGTANEIDVAFAEDTDNKTHTLTIGLPSAVSGLTSISATTVTDGTASMSSGNITGLGNLTGSANNMLLVAGDDAEYDFTGDDAGTIAIQADATSSGIKLRSNTDINGTLAVSSNADLNGTLDVSGATSLAATNTLTDIRGTLSVNEAATFDGTVTVGEDQSGTDVTMHGTAAGANLLWDASDDKLHLSKSYIEMDNSARKDFSATIGADGEDVLVSYPKATFEGAEIVLRSTDGTDRTVKKILVTNTSSVASLVVYGTVNSDANTGDIIGDLAVAINGDNVEVKLASGNTAASADDVMKGTIDLIKA